MKIARAVRRRRSLQSCIEFLENRQLLAATATSQIPTLTLSQSNPSASLALGSYFNDPTVTGTAVLLQTPEGNIPLVLTDSQTPQTVANFTRYITSGEFTNTIIHRSVPGFVIQGGGYTPSGTHIATNGTVPGEHHESNTTGTIAMALSSGPNSATSEWFINLANNNGSNGVNLDDTSDGGPFTAFGNVVYNGLSVADAIAALPIVNDSTQSGAWDTLPVQSGTNGATVTSEPASNLVTTTPEILPGGLTYTVNSSSPSIATASVNSSGGLSITSAGGTGTTNITVTATDMGGGVATSTFAVNVGGLPVVSVANASANANSAGQVVFPVTLSGPSATAVNLTYSLTAGSAPLSDFAAVGSSLTIPAGATTASIPVNISGDTTGVAETFTLELSGLSSNATFADGVVTASATGEILPAGSTTTSTSTVTTMTASASAVAEGTVDTFVATVTASAGTPTGTVQFNIGATTLGTAAVVNGSASLTNILGTPGNQTITATYSGNGSLQGSISNAVTVNVGTLTPSVSRQTLPASVIAGTSQRGTVLAVAANDTGSLLKGLSTFNLYASIDGSVDGSSFLIGTVKREVNLQTGRPVTVPISVKTLPANLSAGTYSLIVQTVDPAGNISNAASGPALKVATPVVSLTPVIARLALPAAVVAGSPTRAVAVIRITNNGNIASTGTTTLALFASTDGSTTTGSAFASISRRISIPAGRTIAVTVPLRSYPNVADGNYYVLAQLTNPQGGVSQVASSNTVNIAAAKIDLANTIVSVPATGRIGRTISVTLSIANNGNIIAQGALQIAFAVSSQPDGSNPVSLATLGPRISIAPGRTRVLRLRVPLTAGIATGAFYLISTLDPANAFTDVNTANNTAISSTLITLG